MKPLSVALESKTKHTVVLLFEKSLSHLRDIVQYEAQCRGPGNEISVGFTRNESDRQVELNNLAPNRQYNCKVSIAVLNIGEKFLSFF